MVSGGLTQFLAINVSISFRLGKISNYVLDYFIFRNNLTEKHLGPVPVFIAEGRFAGMYGNILTSKSLGGFLGFPGGQVPANMPYVDVYSRENDKLSENWIILDLVAWAKDQGLDLMERTKSITNPKWI